MFGFWRMIALIKTNQNTPEKVDMDMYMELSMPIENVLHIHYQ